MFPGGGDERAGRPGSRRERVVRRGRASVVDTLVDRAGELVEVDEAFVDELERHRCDEHLGDAPHPEPRRRRDRVAVGGCIADGCRGRDAVAHNEH
jgi:hypothetical protein